MENLSWENYAIKLAEVAAIKSRDPWKKVGCCLLRHDHTVAGLGYNGFPAQMIEDWSNRDKRRKYVVHAEKNALRYVKPGECYLCAVTLLCCNDCLKDLASYGIKKIIYQEIYDKDDSSLKLAAEFGIELIQIKNDYQKFDGLRINPIFFGLNNFPYQGFISPGYHGDPMPTPNHVGRKVKVVRGPYAGKSGIVTAHWPNGDDCSGNYNQQLYSLNDQNNNTNCFGINVKDCEILD